MTSCHSSDRIGQVGPTERQDVTKEPQSDQTERVNAPHQELELKNLKSRISKVDEMEQGRTAADDANEFSMSVTDERIALATLSWALFLEGWNDGTIGPLLLRIQQEYNISFTVVSLIFVATCVGAIIGAILNVYASGRFGFGKVIVVGALLQAVAFSVLATAPPYPVFWFIQLVNGIGMSMQDAQANAFIASLPRNKPMNMGIIHAAYGAGAFVAPWVSTQFAVMPKWSFHYLVVLGLALTNLGTLIWVFKFKPQEHFIPEIRNRTSNPSYENAYTQIFRLKAVHVMASFLFIYVGAEVTIGGWIVAFIVKERGGGPSSGYVASGFWGGLTLGRIALIWVNKKIGERRVIYIYTVLAIILEFTIWFVPNLVQNAVAISIVGVALAPFFPIAINVAATIIPPRLLAGSVGWMTAFASVGGAAFPFMTGALAQNHGVRVLQPLLVGMLVLMIALWYLVTRIQYDRRGD